MPPLTVATPVLELAHVPPPMVGVIVIDEPAHTADGPEIVVDGTVITVTSIVSVAVPQALLKEYEMIAVPVVTPNTTPYPTVAMESDELLQVPPVPVVVNAVTPPIHNVPLPEIVPDTGATLTVTACVAMAVPQPLVAL